MKIKCMAVDDEPLALELLEDNISKVPYLELVAKCESAIEAMKVLQETEVDLIFLDIQMPGLTGIQFLKSMAVRPMIIMVTAYENYALDGFNLDVTDYLVKPVSLERFVKACNKAYELFQLKNSGKEQSTTTTPDYFFVPVDYSMVKVAINDIVWVEGLKDYIKIHLKASTKPLITRMTMKSIEDQLPSKGFIRIHKSYIVSITHITAVRKTSVFMNEIELPVSDNYKDAVNELTGRN